MGLTVVIRPSHPMHTTGGSGNYVFHVLTNYTQNIILTNATMARAAHISKKLSFAGLGLSGNQ